MSNIVVRAEKLIARPIDVVQSQFVDMAHHERARVHRALEVTNARPVPTGYPLTGRLRVFVVIQEMRTKCCVTPTGARRCAACQAPMRAL